MYKYGMRKDEDVMMEKNVLLFHVGTMKTGTTALQFFLHENQEWLKTQGWCYPNFVEELPEFVNEVRAIESRNGLFFYGKKLEDGIDFNSVKWNRLWECILKYLERDNVILSAECMFEYNLLELLEESKKKYDNIKVVVYLRRQDRQIESRWAELVKGDTACVDSFQTYVDKVENEDEKVQGALNYLQRLMQVEEVVGRENLIVRVYEKEQFVGEQKDVISDFLSSINIKINDSVVMSSMKRNERLPDNYFEIKRIFNVLHNKIPNIGLMDVNRYLWKLMDYYPIQQREIGYFDVKKRELFLKKYEEQNKEIARRYLDREDGILFYDNRKDFPLSECKITSFEEDIIKVFALIVFEENSKLQRDIQDLYLQNKLLIQQFILQMMRGRRLIYFGAGQKCKEILERFQLPVELIVDNDKAKKGINIHGVEVEFFSELKKMEEIFIIVTCDQTEGIESQLEACGLQKGSDYMLAREFM